MSALRTVTCFDVFRGLALALAVWVLAVGCSSSADQGPLWVDPGVVRFSPTHTRARVEIHNRSGTVRPVADFQIGGDDWAALRFVDDAFPRTIPGWDSVIVELEISAANFRVDPATHRSGQASLSFHSNAHEYEVPIEFVADQGRAGFGAAVLGVIVALAGAFVWWRRRSPKEAPPSTTALAAVAWFGLLLAAATLPVGFGLCSGRLGLLVGPRELAQCRAGLGGAELLALPTDLGLWWWFVALGISLAAFAALRVRAPATTALSCLRLLGFALLVLALDCGLAPTDPSTTTLALTQAATTKFTGLTVPRWGMLLQPLGFVLGLALLTTTGPLVTSEDRGVAALEHLELLVWSGLITTLFLAGPALPWLSLAPIPPLPHGLTILLELGSFAAKLALLTWLTRQTRSWLSERGRTETDLIRQTARWIIPLALLNLLGVMLYRSVL